MGSGQRKASEAALQQQSALAQDQANLSRKTAERADPWSALAGKYYTDVVTGGDALMRATAPQMNAATGQFSLARQRAKEMPLGGLRDRALRDLNATEAATKSSILSGGVNDALAKLASMGLGGTDMALGGYGAASNNLSNIAQSYAQMAQGKGSSMAGLAGAGGSIAAAAI
jgi:hypothetical protein